MVKGVNKTVIEINDTGNIMFEKIVFYVTPEYGNMSAKRLKKAAGNMVENMDIPVTNSLRERVRKKQRNKVIISLAAVVAALVLLLIILL